MMSYNEYSAKIQVRKLLTHGRKWSVYGERGRGNLGKSFLKDVTLDLCLKIVGFARKKNTVRGRKN